MSCEAEEQAVADIKESLRMLRLELQHATGTGKAEIIQEIKETEKELRKANAALAACQGALTGTVGLTYLVLTVLYAPPGTNGGRSSSQVAYGDGSTTGSSVSTTSSFRQGVNVLVKGTGGIFSGGEASFDMAVEASDTSTVDVKKSEQFDLKISGPGADGINHDNDVIVLWLNPLLDITMLRDGTRVEWALGNDGPIMHIQYVYVAWLKNPQLMPSGVQQALAAVGVTPADYPQILSVDPFALGDTNIDSNRFIPVPRSFPYEPPLTAGDPVLTQTFTQKNDLTRTNILKTTTEYTVALSASGGIDFFGLFTATLTVKDTFKWTDSSTYGTSSASSQSAQVTIGGPSFGYDGPTDVLVYWDTIFSSFMFVFATVPPSFTRTLTDKATGKPIANAEVTVEFEGSTYRTFTNARGQFRIYEAPQGQVGSATVARPQQFSIQPGVAIAEESL